MELEQHHHVPAPTAPESGKTSAWNVDGVARRGALRDTDFERLPVEMIQRDGRAQRKVGVAQRQGHDEVASASLKVGVWRHFKLHQQVTGGLSITSWLALSTEAKTGAVFCSGGNAEPKRGGLLFAASALARFAGGSGNLPSPVTRRARAILPGLEGTHLHHPRQHTSPLAVGTGVQDPAFRTCSRTGHTGGRKFEFNLFIRAVHHVLAGNGMPVEDVAAPAGPLTSTTSTKERREDV